MRKNKPSMMATPWRLKLVQDAVKGKIFDKSVANRRVPWPRAATATFLVPCDRIDSKLPRVVFVILRLGLDRYQSGDPKLFPAGKSAKSRFARCLCSAATLAGWPRAPRRPACGPREPGQDGGCDHRRYGRRERR